MLRSEASLTAISGVMAMSASMADNGFPGIRSSWNGFVLHLILFVSFYDFVSWAAAGIDIVCIFICNHFCARPKCFCKSSVFRQPRVCVFVSIGIDQRLGKEKSVGPCRVLLLLE